MINNLTIILPVYNGEKYLRLAIDSILNQTYRDFDFIIINDGSTDNSEQIIKTIEDSRIKLLNNQGNKGLIFSLNRGLRNSQSKYVARMDQDDICLPERFEVQMRFLVQNPETVVLGSDFTVIDEEGKGVNQLANPITDEMIRRSLAVINPFAHGSVIMNRQVAVDIGGYRKDCYLVEDLDLWQRMSKKGKLANIPKPLYLWRQNPTSECGSKSQQMNQAAQKIHDQIWNEYGNQGPFALTSKEYRFYSDEKSLSDNPAHRKLLRLIHLHFADGYAKRKHYKQKQRHVVAAMRYQDHLLLKLLMMLAMIFPAGWIKRVKNISFIYRNIKRIK